MSITDRYRDVEISEQGRVRSRVLLTIEAASGRRAAASPLPTATARDRAAHGFALDALLQPLDGFRLPLPLPMRAARWLVRILIFFTRIRLAALQPFRDHLVHRRLATGLRIETPLERLILLVGAERSRAEPCE